MERHTTIKIKKLNKYPNIERRSWEAWTLKENQMFFSCLKKYKRNWKEISNVIKTKKPEQVRTYYYRLLRKISKILKSVNFTMDNKDKGNAVVLMLGYWRAKCEIVYEECRKEFAEYLKNCVIEQLNMIDCTKTSFYPTKDTFPIQTLDLSTDLLKKDDDNNSDTGSETLSEEEIILNSSPESLNFVNDCNYMNFNAYKSYFDSDMCYKSTIGEDFVDTYFYNDNILYNHNF